MFTECRWWFSDRFNHRLILLHHILTSLVRDVLMCLWTAYVYLAIDLLRHAQYRNCFYFHMCLALDVIWLVTYSW